MMNQAECIDKLSQEYLLHIDMIEALRRGLGVPVYAESDAVLLRVHNGYEYMLAADTTKAAESAVAAFEEMPCCVSHSEAALAVIKRVYGHDYLSCCYQAVYTEKTPVPVAEGVDIRLLDTSYAAFCAEQYSLYHDEDEMRETLQRGDMLGAFVDGQIAGFIGFHDDGSNGMLEVLPAYRRRGLGRALEASVLNLALSRGFTPYGQVFTDNRASIALQRQMGVALSQTPVYWTMYRESREEE